MWQVQNGNGQSYRFMKYPFQRQKLQLLYPGRYMSNQWDYTGSNIPNEDPEGLERTRNTRKILSGVAHEEEEAISRRLGGVGHISPQAADPPDAIVNDPQLTMANATGMRGPSPYPTRTPEPSLSATFNKEDTIVDNLRQQLSIDDSVTTSPKIDPDDIFYNYDWKDISGNTLPVVETFAFDTDGAPESSNTESKFSMWMMVFVIVAVLFIIGVVLTV